ncbi:unnamed protein product [Meloidogyne enterolobii]|uniref:Uncharacterized protein n=1 Tax=Meloidogyne enterolobii TaxID=390850 RepID=A0ACB1A1G8_MELEN
MEFDEDDEGPVLPKSNSEEFRPFMRRLPEFKFWLSTMKSTLVAFTCTFFEVFDVPVFWPILVMYFIGIFYFVNSLHPQEKSLNNFKFWVSDSNLRLHVLAPSLGF